jgi:prevent-host-death family protein
MPYQSIQRCWRELRRGWLIAGRSLWLCGHIFYTGVLMMVSVRQLKGSLSRYLKRAAAGEEVTVTSRGRPVARLVRAAPQDSEQREPSAAEIRRRLAAIPGLIPGKPGKPRGSRRPIRIGKGEKTLSEIVLEDRR